MAFVRNRYATRIYPVTASIIIKETEETGGGELLYKNALIDPYRNYLNELYIIKSYPLIQSVLEDLNFGVSFYLEGNFLTTEAYGYLPFSATVLDNGGGNGARFMFEVIDENKFELYPNGGGNSKDKVRTRFAFGDTIRYGGISAVFNLEKHNIREVVNKPFIFHYQHPSAITGVYVGKVDASWAEEGAGVINLKTSGPNPKKDIDFLNGLIDRYQLYDLDKKNQTATRTIEFISDQLIEMSDSLHRVESVLENFKSNNVITDLSEEAQRVYEKVEEIELERTGYLLHENYYQYAIDYINQGKDLDLIILPESVGMEGSLLNSLLNRMIEAQLQIKLLMSKNKVESPFVTEQIKTLADIKSSITEAIKNQRAADKIALGYVDQRLKAYERQLERLPASERKLISIKRNYSLLENLYIFLLQKRAEASISRASSISDIVIVNPPMQVGGSILPKIRQNYILALTLGLAIPLGIFILLEFLNQRIQSREDIEHLTAIPFIGGVGHKRQDTNLEVFAAPKSAVAESFRALRSNLSYFMGGNNKGVFLVTSSISGEGKTFTSINLASVLALSGRKTLIIGADMRRPKIYSDFDLNNDVGLSSYLAGLSDFSGIIQATTFDNLHLVSGGPVPPNPSELLLKEEMKAFIQRAREEYDYVIIDSPPLALVADAFTLSLYADHTLFLVRQNYTPKDLLRTAEDFFSSGKLKHISIVFNDIYRSGPGYGYGYGYSYGYGYGYGYGKSKNGYGYYED